MTEQHGRLSVGNVPGPSPISGGMHWQGGPGPSDGDSHRPRNDYDGPEGHSQSQMIHTQYHHTSPPHPPHGQPTHHNSPENGSNYDQQNKQQQRSPPTHPGAMYGSQSKPMRSPPGHSHPNMYPHGGHPPPHMAQPTPQSYPHQQNMHPHHQYGPPHHGYGMPPPQHQMYHAQWQHSYPPHMSHGQPSHGHYHPSSHPYPVQQPQPSQSKVPKHESGAGDEKKETEEKSPEKSPAKDETSPKKETEPLKVTPMRQDFYFYVEDYKSKVMEDANVEILKHLTLKENDEIDPLILLTNVNERLIKMWENVPSSVRKTYQVKEEEDRKRFMCAEEVAAQHCATLTARVKSPAFSKKDGLSIEKDKTEKSISEDLEEENAANETKINENQEEEERKNLARPLSEFSPDLGGESPTKKNKIDDSNKENNENEKVEDVGKEERIESKEFPENMDEDDAEEESLEIDQLLDRRIRTVRGKKVKEYLVRWKKFGSESDSWEPFKNVEHCDDQVMEIDLKKEEERRMKKE